MNTNVKAVVFDIDGVITDGKKYLCGQEETKSVALKDLDAIHMLKEEGYIVGAITGESTPFAQRLKEELSLDFFILGCKKKWEELQKSIEKYHISKTQVCYIGDGKYDMEALGQAGLSVCPSDAIYEVKELSKHVLKTPGGEGCIAEVYTMLHHGVGAGKEKDHNETIVQRMKEHESILQRLSGDAERTGALSEIIEEIVRCYQRGGKLMLCGNGGSAADAQHLATELVSKFYKEREALPAVALNVNTSTITAIANDYQYDKVFSRQVEAFGKEGDVLLGISTRGKARSVIEAFKTGGRKGIRTILFTGELEEDAEIVKYTDLIFKVPSKDTPRIQEMHILAGHIVCEEIERSIVENEREKRRG